MVMGWLMVMELADEVVAVARVGAGGGRGGGCSPWAARVGLGLVLGLPCLPPSSLATLLQVWLQLLQPFPQQKWSHSDSPPEQSFLLPCCLSAACFCGAVVNRREANCVQKGSELFDHSFELPSTKINIYGFNSSGFKTF